MLPTVFLGACTRWHLSPLKQSFWWKNLVRQRIWCDVAKGKCVLRVSMNA